MAKNDNQVYYAPIEIKDKADLDNYGISWNDCKTLHFGASESITVYYLPTTSKELVDLQWAELNTAHSRSYRSTRCMVPGKRKSLIVCPDTNRCSACPYHMEPDKRQSRFVSLDEPGWEMPQEDAGFAAKEAWAVFEKVKAHMDAKDKNIAKVVVLKEMYGYDVTQIAAKLGLTERQVYYYLQQAKQIGKEYHKRYVIE